MENIKYFNLTDGSLEFHENKLVIFDKAESDRKSNLFLSISQILLSLSFLFKGIRTNDNEILYFGIFLSIIWSALIIIKRRHIFFRISNEYKIKDIHHVKVSMDKYEGSIIALLFTKAHRQRRIKLVNENNQDFVMKNLLIKYEIPID